MAVSEVELTSIDDTAVMKYPHWWTVGVKVTDAPPQRGNMSRLFDGYGDYIRITKEDIDAMADGKISWRDGAVVYGTVVYANGPLGEPAFRGVIDKDKWTKVNERNRTYHFANGATTSVDCTAWLWVSNSGTHYIKDSDGKIHIINKSWVRITITEQEGHGRDADNQITPGTV